MSDDRWEIRYNIDRTPEGWQRTAAEELAAEVREQLRATEAKMIDDMRVPEERQLLGPAPALPAPMVEPIHVGFTGTRTGMTLEQVETFAHLITTVGPFVVFHHGDCVGADEIAHNVCFQLGIPSVVHPPTNGSLRANVDNAFQVLKPKRYLERNRDIMKASSRLYACPKSYTNRHGGTWNTISYATNRIPVTIIWPDGTTLETTP
jgi:hypothetical protein